MRQPNKKHIAINKINNFENVIPGIILDSSGNICVSKEISPDSLSLREAKHRAWRYR